MNRVILVAVVLAASCSSPDSLTENQQTVWAAAGDETPLASRIVSVGLFKNGLAVVRRTATVPTSGTYLVDDVPVPVHGTYWVESDARITTRISRRIVELPEEPANGIDFQEDLAGKEVAIHFAEIGVPPVKGTVIAIESPGDEWNRDYRTPQYGNYFGGRASNQAPNRMLVLKTERGRSYVDTSRIAHLEAFGAAPIVRKRKPVMLFAVATAEARPATISITYLAKGMAWVPSYRVDISHPKTLTLRQKAVIKNELAGIEEAEIHLISGYPSIQFSHVNSPLSPGSTWSTFFQQLNQAAGSRHASMSNVLSQQAISFNSTSSNNGNELAAIPTGEGVDLHYQNIGKQVLDEGDSLSLETAAGKANYERLVEWLVPDTRNAHGQYVSEHERNQNPEKFQDAAWDAVRFRNPLDFPMTTAPAMIVAGNRFNGQQTSYWVNAGEETTLHVTKALSVRTRNIEHEQAGQREIVHVGGHQYRKATVVGELIANNHRDETIKLVIQRRFSGELLTADQSPISTLREEGVWSVNKRNQLTWTLALRPGEEVKLAYVNGARKC
ncbi:MAG: hypothetical protein QGG71_08805 [Pirellulaceae bacterium]|jgi:hypothetical protein|nr:hypothetical protein [Pirellulaceae bacterium]